MKILLSLLGLFAPFLLGLVFPYKPSYPLINHRIFLNKSRYNKLELLSLPLVFISIILICCFTYIIGITIRDYLFINSYHYIIKPPSSYFLLCGILLGFGLIRIPLELIYKRILKDEYLLYIEYANSKYGFDGLNAWRFFEIVLTSCGIILFIWGMNWYVRIDKDNKDIEINELFSFENRKYPLSEIKEIKSSTSYIKRKGIQREAKHYLLLMNDNYIWNSKFYTFFASENDTKRLTHEIQNLSVLINNSIIYSSE